MPLNRQNNETPTEMIFGPESPLINTSDATVKRIAFEKNAHDRACFSARAQFDKLIASYDAVFADRVGRILQDVEVQLPPLPPQFLAEGTNNGEE